MSKNSALRGDLSRFEIRKRRAFAGFTMISAAFGGWGIGTWISEATNSGPWIAGWHDNWSGNKAAREAAADPRNAPTYDENAPLVGPRMKVLNEAFQTPAGQDSVVIPYRTLSEEDSEQPTRPILHWEIEIGLADGRLPQPGQLLQILRKLATSAGGLETHQAYYVRFYFPGMAQKDNGIRTSYAMATLKPDKQPVERIEFFEMNQGKWPAEFQGLTVPAGDGENSRTGRK